MFGGGGRCSRTRRATGPAGTSAGRAGRGVRRHRAAVVLLGRPLGAAHLVLAAAVVVLVAAAGAPALVGVATRCSSALGVLGLLALLGGLLVLLVPGPPRPGPRPSSLPLALALTTAMPTLARRLSRSRAYRCRAPSTDLAEVPGQLELEQVPAARAAGPCRC